MLGCPPPYTPVTLPSLPLPPPKNPSSKKKGTPGRAWALAESLLSRPVPNPSATSTPRAATALQSWLRAPAACATAVREKEPVTVAAPLAAAMRLAAPRPTSSRPGRRPGEPTVLAMDSDSARSTATTSAAVRSWMPGASRGSQPRRPRDGKPGAMGPTGMMAGGAPFRLRPSSGHSDMMPMDSRHTASGPSARSVVSRACAALSRRSTNSSAMKLAPMTSSHGLHAGWRVEGGGLDRSAPRRRPGNVSDQPQQVTWRGGCKLGSAAVGPSQAGPHGRVPGLTKSRAGP